MPNTYRTSDLAEIAFLTLKHRVLDIEKNPETNRIFFVLEATDEMNKDKRDFWNRDALVSPVDYHNSIIDAKARIYAEQRKS